MKTQQTQSRSSAVSLLKETLVAFDQSKTLPGKPTRDQLCNWRKNGVRVGDGQENWTPVRLECLKIGGRPFTTREAYDRFVERINS